jgi:hypothetical protein
LNQRSKVSTLTSAFNAAAICCQVCANSSTLGKLSTVNSSATRLQSFRSALSASGIPQPPQAFPPGRRNPQSHSQNPRREYFGRKKPEPRRSRKRVPRNADRKAKGEPARRTEGDVFGASSQVIHRRHAGPPPERRETNFPPQARQENIPGWPQVYFQPRPGFKLTSGLAAVKPSTHQAAPPAT